MRGAEPRVLRNPNVMKKHMLLFAAWPLLVGAALPLQAQTTAFTYQGRLSSGSGAANGSYDLRFALYDVASAGTPQGNGLTNAATAVTNGLFTVALDFGNQFPRTSPSSPRSRAKSPRITTIAGG